MDETPTPVSGRAQPGWADVAIRLALAALIVYWSFLLLRPFIAMLIWAAILGYLLFAEVPGAFIWLGGAMIFAAATYIAYRENQVAKAEEAERKRSAEARLEGPAS